MPTFPAVAGVRLRERPGQCKVYSRYFVQGGCRSLVVRALETPDGWVWRVAYA